LQLTWNNSSIDFSHIDNKRLLDDWEWLIGTEMTPILISSIGDMLLEDFSGSIYWLNIGDGNLENVPQISTNLKYSTCLQ